MKLGNNNKLFFKDIGLKDVVWIQLAKKGANSNILSGLIKKRRIFLTYCMIVNFVSTILYSVFLFSPDYSLEISGGMKEL